MTQTSCVLPSSSLLTWGPPYAHGVLFELCKWWSGSTRVKWTASWWLSIEKVKQTVREARGWLSIETTFSVPCAYQAGVTDAQFLNEPIKLITNITFGQAVNHYYMLSVLISRGAFVQYTSFDGPFSSSVIVSGPFLVLSLHVFPKQREHSMGQKLAGSHGRDHWTRVPISDERNNVQNKVLKMWTQQCSGSHRQWTRCQLQCQQWE